MTTRQTRIPDHALREKVLPKALRVMSVEQLEFRRNDLERRLPTISEAEGTELSGIYSFFRARSAAKG